MVERMLDLCDWQDPERLQLHNAILFLADRASHMI